MTPPQITVVIDRDSTLTPSLTQWNDPTRGVVVGMVRSTARQSGWLANDLVAALGKTSGRGFNADGWAVAAAHLVPWLVVDDIRHLVVGYAEVLPANQLGALTHLAVLAEVSIWFVSDGVTSDTLAGFANDFGARTLNAEDFTPDLLNVPPSAGQEPSKPEEPPFPPTVPEDTFTTFLSTARRTMTERAFAQVTSLFLPAFDDTRAWLEELDCAPTELEVARHVSALVEDQATLARVTTIMRGVQAASFRHGLLIRLDARRFLNRMRETRTALDLQEGEWRLLSNNGNTRQCAIAVLAALGLPVSTIHTLKTDQVAHDASSVRVDDLVHQVPAAARPLLLAHLIYRASAADPSDPLLLAGSRKDAVLTERGVSMAIDDLARTTGIAFRAAHDRWDSDSNHWRQRTGISVAEVAT